MKQQKEGLNCYAMFIMPHDMYRLDTSRRHSPGSVLQETIELSHVFTYCFLIVSPFPYNRAPLRIILDHLQMPIA